MNLKKMLQFVSFNKILVGKNIEKVFYAPLSYLCCGKNSLPKSANAAEGEDRQSCEWALREASPYLTSFYQNSWTMG